tara:strand:+ start:269 stop:523 length:255 start_codon:yes stop_codon:yes gene_type:complete
LLVVVPAEDELSSLSSLDDEAIVSDVELSELAQEFMFRLKNKIIKISMKKSLRLEIFFNEKEMRPLSNPNAVNIISHLGIIEIS